MVGNNKYVELLNERKAVFNKLYSIVQMIKGRPGAFFGQNEYSFKEVIAYLNGHVTAANLYTNIDKRSYTSLVKAEMKKMYDVDPNMHIIDMFDSVCENEQEKVTLLLEILIKFNI